jgi:SAM-dependent methyltransferase
VELYGKVQQELVRHELQGISWIHVYHCRSCCLCFFEPKTPGSPEFYASLQSFEWYYLKDKAEYEMAIKWIPSNARVLEVGCGVGWFAKRLHLSQYTGLEYSESAAEEARTGGLDVRTQSVQEHSLAHKSAYQVVCAFQVLEHVPDPASFIAACVDCLEPGGLLIYAVPSDDSYLQFLQNAALNLPPHHLTRWPDKTLEAIPTYFPVSLVAIEHEVVSDIHLKTCVSTMIRRRLDALFGRSQAIVDRSVGARLVGRCAHVLAGWSSTIFDDLVFRPRGHSVIATYRKQMPADSK